MREGQILEWSYNERNRRRSIRRWARKKYPGLFGYPLSDLVDEVESNWLITSLSERGFLFMPVPWYADLSDYILAEPCEIIRSGDVITYRQHPEARETVERAKREIRDDA